MKFKDLSSPRLDGEDIRFVSLSEVKDDLISRVKYPTNENTLNGANWKEAVYKLTDGANKQLTSNK